jgi:hypothetical protein
MDDKSFDEFIKGKALEEKILLPSGINQKITSTFKELPKRKKYHTRLFRLGSVAAILAFCVLTSIGFASPSLASNVRNISYTISSNISNFLGLQKNLDEYQTVINKAVTDKSITVKLNEVILNGNELTVSYSINSNKKLEAMESWHALNEIYVNGKKANTGASGSSRNMDNYTTQEVLTYSLDKVDSSADLNIKILCSSILVNGKETKGSWNFEFKTNGSKLLIDTKEILLNYKITLENGGEYTLKKYTDNSLGQEIYASTSDPKELITVALRGFDDLGNKVEFTVRHQGEDNALFTIETIDGNLNENAKTLTLTPYTSTWGIYKKVGNQFIIDLSLLK